MTWNAPWAVFDSTLLSALDFLGLKVATPPPGAPTERQFTLVVVLSRDLPDHIRQQLSLGCRRFREEAGTKDIPKVLAVPDRAPPYRPISDNMVEVRLFGYMPEGRKGDHA